jgi:hypothetical protein
MFINGNGWRITEAHDAHLLHRIGGNRDGDESLATIFPRPRTIRYGWRPILTNSLVFWLLESDSSKSLLFYIDCNNRRNPLNQLNCFIFLARQLELQSSTIWRSRFSFSWNLRDRNTLQVESWYIVESREDIGTAWRCSTIVPWWHLHLWRTATFLGAQRYPASLS